MEQIGAYEAKTHLPKLLNKVSKGEKVIITKHGIPVAILAPYDDCNKFASSETIEKLKKFRRNKKLKELNFKMLIEAGRD